MCIRDSIITFDAHDPRVVNAILLNGFENVMPSYQFIKGILKNVKDITIDADHLMIISPVEICGIEYFTAICFACVPLPAPGAPNIDVYKRQRENRSSWWKSRGDLMLKTLRNAFKIKDVRNRILFT